VYLLDTDVLIDVQRGHPPAVAWFSSQTQPLAVPGFVVMELIQAARNSAELHGARKLVAPFPVVWPTEADCARALADLTTLRLSHSLGLIDAVIAATAVGQNATLCTFNLKHYRAVPGLTLTQPYNR
jgi:predicted nucleic acid-binding protein